MSYFLNYLSNYLIFVCLITLFKKKNLIYTSVLNIDQHVHCQRVKGIKIDTWGENINDIINYHRHVVKTSTSWQYLQNMVKKIKLKSGTYKKAQPIIILAFLCEIGRDSSFDFFFNYNYKINNIIII